MTYFGGVLQDAEAWVSNHLSHHAHTDTALDPYSVYWPYKGGIRGLWWAHMGCLCWKFTAPDRFMKSAQLQSSVVRWEHKWHVLIVASGFAAPFLIGGISGVFFRGWGWFFFYGLDAFVLTVISTVMMLHVTCFINSLGHWLGWRARDKADRLYETDSSRDNSLLAFISFGEGNHGQHHKYPGSARIGWLDTSWPVILLFEKMGFVAF